MNNPVDPADSLLEIQRAIDAIPPRMGGQIRFEVEQFLARLELLAQKGRTAAFGENIDRSRLRGNMFEFLRDDLIYFLQKMLANRQVLVMRVPDIAPPQREIRHALRELNVNTYYPQRDFSKTAVLERWYLRLYRRGGFSLEKGRNYLDIFRNLMYSLTDDAPFEFADPRSFALRLLTSKDYGLSFDEVYDAELVLREEILFALLRRTTRANRIEYLISKEIITQISDKFVRTLHEEAELRLKADVERLTLMQKEADKSRTMIESEIKNAVRMQRNLQRALPKPSPRITFAAWSEPLLAVGGDYYRIDQINEEEYAIFLGDISGHGLGAAMYTNTVHVALEENLSSRDRPERLLRKMNESLVGKLGDTFVTAICIYIHLGRRILKYSNAGHPKAFLIRTEKGRQRPRFLRPNGRVLGVFLKNKYREVTMPLDPENRLVVYTDGITELLGSESKGEFLGERDFLRMFHGIPTGNPSESLDQIREKVRTWQGTAPLEDDRTVILADIMPDAPREST